MKITKLLLTIIVFSFIVSCQINAQSKKEYSPTCSHSDVKTQAILFEKGKLYEIAIADVIPEKMEQLNVRYFPKVLELSGKYGGKMIGGFEVVKNESQNLPGNMVAIFEWDSPDSRLNLLADEGFQKIVPLRDKALKGVQLGYFQVAKSQAIVFRSDKVYEFGAADLKLGKEAQETLQKYFEVSEPIKRNYGGAYPEFIINFEHADSKGQATFIPQMQFIVEWDSVEDNTKLLANKDFETKAAPLLTSAIAKFDAVFAKFNFQ